mgnify:CR=1 FL=1
MTKYLRYILLFGLLFAAKKKGKIKTDFNISGVVIGVDGEGLKKVKLTIFDEDKNEIESGKTKGDGEFKFKKIPPGSYLIEASHKSEGEIDIPFVIEKADLEGLKIDYSQKNTTLSELIVNENINEKPVSEVLPQQRKRTDSEKLKFENLFFDYESNLNSLKIEIDSLKNVVRSYEKGQSMPNIDRKILEMIKIPDFQHRVELQNGTVVSGELLQESDSTLTLKTQIGTLVLKKEMVVRMNELEKPGPKIIFLGEPYVDYYPDRQIFSGRVKNVGQIRADFVRVLGTLFDQTTEKAGSDSVFVKGTRIAYDSNVVADTALQPGQTASYKLTVSVKKGKKPQYHTMDINWNQTQ